MEGPRRQIQSVDDIPVGTRVYLNSNWYRGPATVKTISSSDYIAFTVDNPEICSSSYQKDHTEVGYDLYSFLRNGGYAIDEPKALEPTEDFYEELLR